MSPRAMKALLVLLLSLPARAAGDKGWTSAGWPKLTPAVAAPAVAGPALPQLQALPKTDALALPALPGSPLAGANAATALPQVVKTAQAAEAALAGRTTAAAHHEAAAGVGRSFPAPSTAEQTVGIHGAELRAAFETPAPDRLADVDTIPQEGKAYHASPVDWRDEILYSVMVDRFARSKDGKAVGDPKSGLTRHGGDLRGIIEQLDYIKGSGVTTLLLSPVTQTVAEAYHGYAPVHFMKVDPHMGTMEDLKELVAKAHKKGMRVVLDMVINHTGPVFEYKGGPSGSGWSPMDQPRKEIGYWTSDLKPSELTDPDRFTRRGVINNWDDHDQATHGDFPPNYRHLATDDKLTQDDLIKIAQWWIKETDIDGLRLDAIRHVDQGFLKRFNDEIAAYAKTLGKDNFLLLGENSTGVDSELNDGFAKGLNSLYDYPQFRRVLYALHGKSPTRQLEDSFYRSLDGLKAALDKVVRFIDNHDTYRFLRNGEDPRRLLGAFAFLLFSTGIPLIYYGTEQGFRTAHQVLEPENGKLPADPENRQDMFGEGQFKTESSAGDKFEPSSPTYKFLARLAELRAKHPALRRGFQFYRWTDMWGPGISAFSRIHEGQEVVVAQNTADAARQATMYVDAEHSPAGTVFVDELDPTYTVTAFRPPEGGSKITVDMPPVGVRVLVRKTA